MENCVDVVLFNASHLVMIKQPGSTRNSVGHPIKYIECSLAEAVELESQLVRMLKDAEAKRLL